MDEAQQEFVEKVYWERAEPFNPSSSKQLQAYLTYRGIKIPKHRTSGALTTNAESIKQICARLPEGDPVLSLLLDLRNIDKARSYLSDKYVWSDGRMHPVFTTLPTTGRLSARRPNIMNQPQPGRGSKIVDRAATEIRRNFIADPGYLLGEFDWKAVEALLTGFFANDQDYVASAKKGVHDIFGSHLLYRDGIISAPKTPYDADLPEWVKWFKKTHDNVRQKAKKRIYAGAYGQGPVNMAKDLGVSVKEVRELDAVFASMAPKVIAWQQATRLRAHKDGRLTNPFGWSLSFSNVLDSNGAPATEAFACLAFLPQSTCASMLKAVFVALGTHPDEGTKFMIQSPEHDAIKFQVREDCVDEVMTLIKNSMERPWPELDGLSVEVEGKLGVNRAEMKPWHG